MAILMLLPLVAACDLLSPSAMVPADGDVTATAAVRAGWPQAPTRTGQYLSMRDAKRTLRRLYDRAGVRTLYADCVFEHWRIDWSRCCYEPREGERKRLEWEHVVPASTFGRQLHAWKKGDATCRGRHGLFKGRRCARRASKTFREMEADMHNLFPSIGEINKSRAHYPMAIIAGETRRYGSCDVEISHQQVEPRPGARGEIARAYLYMHWRYPSHDLLNSRTRTMMLQWHHSDPPDNFERTRNTFIATHQGIGNPWVK